MEMIDRSTESMVLLSQNSYFSVYAWLKEMFAHLSSFARYQRCLCTRDQKDWDISNMPDNTGPKCSEWRRNCEQLTGLLIPMQKFKFMLKFIYWLLSWNKSNEMASYNGRILTKITSLYSELDCKVLCINYENVFPITRKLILYLSHLFLLTVWLCWQ